MASRSSITSVFRNPSFMIGRIHVKSERPKIPLSSSGDMPFSIVVGRNIFGIFSNIRIASLIPVAVVKRIEILVSCIESHNVLMRTASKITMIERYVVRIADGLTDLMCSVWERAIMAGTTTTDIIAAATVHRVLKASGRQYSTNKATSSAKQTAMSS